MPAEPRYAPPPALARFVKSARVVRRGGELRYERLPDGEADLVVRSGPGGVDLHVIGTRTRALQKRNEPLASALVVRFHAAGAYPFFGAPMSELTDRVISIRALWRGEGERVEEALSEGGGPRVEELFAALLGRLRSGAAFDPESSPAVRRAVRQIHEADRLPRVGELARAVGMSERHLRRAFDEVVGVGPKRYLRIVRFRRTLSLAASAPHAGWSAIAERSGYFDQAHLIADFREMTGETPAAYLARRMQRVVEETRAAAAHIQATTTAPYHR